MRRRELEQIGNLLHGPRWLAGFFGLLFAGKWFNIHQRHSSA